MWWWRRRNRDEEFKQEIDTHLALDTERFIADGMSPEEARAAAQRAFGNVARVQERFYESGMSFITIRKIVNGRPTATV